MGLFKHILLIFICVGIHSTCLFSNDFSEETDSIEFFEYETFAYSAVAANSAADISNLAKESVTSCYNAFKPDYDWEVAKVKERYGPPERCSATKLAIIQSAKSFAKQIIAQIDSLTKQLQPGQKQQFWSVAGGEMQSKLKGFCSYHGCTSTGDLNAYINDQVNLKKQFG